MYIQAVITGERMRRTMWIAVGLLVVIVGCGKKPNSGAPENSPVQAALPAAEGTLLDKTVTVDPNSAGLQVASFTLPADAKVRIEVQGPEGRHINLVIMPTSDWKAKRDAIMSGDHEKWPYKNWRC